MTLPFHMLLPCVLLVAATGAAAGAQSFSDIRAPAPGGFDRVAAARTTRSVLEDLIALDTRNPPGNESVAAAYFDSLLGGLEGVETHVLEAQPGRGNFVAVLRAPRATKKPVLVMGHMDVVGADTTKWETPPLEPTERSGYLYGRGAIDDKGMLAATAAALLQLAPRRAELERDVIFLGTAGEESGSEAGDVGVDWVLETHGDLIGDAEFALNEGGRVRVEEERVRSVGIQTTEKVSYNVQMIARGTGGHGSVPLPGNALAALARAAARIHAWRAPVRLNETTRLYFAGLAKMEEDPPKRAAMERVATSRDSAEVARAAEALASDPLHDAVLRSAGSLTMIDGGFRANVIPSEGTANFNLRVLPDDDPAALLEEIRRAGAEDSVSYRLSREPEKAPPASPVTSDLYRAMERAAGVMAPGAVVMPFMSTGGTDGAVFRRNGIPTYGILPLPLPLEDELRMHGDNERVPLASLAWAAEYIYRVLEDVAGGQASRSGVAAGSDGAVRAAAGA